MVKDKETPEEVDELTGWRKLHEDYLQKKEAEEKEKKEREEKERREKLKTVPKLEKSEEVEEDIEEKEDDIPKIPFVKEEPKPAEKKPKKVFFTRHVLRAIPVLGVFTLTTLLAVYFITPLATHKKLQVSGNQEVSTEMILKSSAIRDEDYTITTFLSRNRYEKNIQDASSWIRSVHMTYRFPDRFDIQIEEYPTIAYEVRDGKYYPILTNGAVVPEAKEVHNPDSYLLVRFQDQKKMTDLMKQIESLPTSLRQSIKTIELTPSGATDDLLTLTMVGDHKVIVPLSELKRKLSYYPSIVSQLTEPSVVDMESGIFSYSQTASAKQEDEEAKAKEKTENEQESTEPQTEGVEPETTENSQEIGT